MDSSPWLVASAAGWDNTLIDFIVWEYKLLGIQHITLAKRFFAIRFAHISDGYEDLSLRARRVKTVIKAIKLRGKTCKKVPFNTDLLRWIHTKMEVSKNQSTSPHIASIWAEILVASFFCLRISELLSLIPRDIKFIDDPEGLALSILVRSSKTDQGEKGALLAPSGQRIVYCAPSGR